MVVPTFLGLLGEVSKIDSPCEVFRIRPGTKSTCYVNVNTCSILLAGLLLVRFRVLLSFLKLLDVECISRSWTFVYGTDCI